jgi:hypothetical protein
MGRRFCFIHTHASATRSISREPALSSPRTSLLHRYRKRSASATMATHQILQFSPPKLRTALTSTPTRKKHPSPEERCLPCTTVLFRKHSNTTTHTGSPVKKRRGVEEDHDHSQADVQFEIQLGVREPSQDLARTFAKSKRIELDYTLVDDDGHALAPPNWSELAGMLKRAFPTTYAVEVSPPYLIVRLELLPPSPWPFTIGRLPLCFTDNGWEDYFDRGVLGRGGEELQMINLRRGDKLSEDVLEQSLGVFQARGVKVHEIFCFDGFWRIVIPDATDLKRVPRVLGGQVCFYKFKSEVLDPDPSALQAKVPQGVDFDDSNYVTTPDALLRPGIMVTSSLRTITENGEMIDVYKKTTSGILVVNKDGHPFITVATHGFEADGLVYHPNPVTGSVIGRIVEHLPGTDISVIELNPGLRYTNHTFGSEVNPDGIAASGISPGYPPHLRTYDLIAMDNPYSGFSEGSVLATGYKLPEEGSTEYVRHSWDVFENGSEPVDGSCGCPILDEQGMVVGLWRFKMEGTNACLAVSAMELRRFGFEVCGEEQKF